MDEKLPSSQVSRLEDGSKRGEISDQDATRLPSSFPAQFQQSSTPAPQAGSRSDGNVGDSTLERFRRAPLEDVLKTGEVSLPSVPSGVAQPDQLSHPPVVQSPDVQGGLLPHEEATEDEFPLLQQASPSTPANSGAGIGQLGAGRSGVVSRRRAGGGRFSVQMLGWIFFALGLVAVIVVAAIGLPLVLNDPPSSSQGLRATSTALSHNATATAQGQGNAQATATSLASTYPFSNNLVLSDPLTSNAGGHGWTTGQVSPVGPGSCNFEGTKGYHVQITMIANVVMSCSASKTTFKNVTYEVTLHNLQGKGLAGILLHRGAAKSVGQALMIAADGSYGIFQAEANGLTLKSLVRGKVAGFKANQTHRLGLVYRDGQLQAFLDATLLKSAEDQDGNTDGAIGVIVQNGTQAGGSTSAFFTDARVWQL